MAATTDALTRTAVRITRGIWACAGLTMAGSALTGALTFERLHEFWGIGLATAIAVDVALWVVLTGDHQLQRLGLDSGSWGRAMRIGTAGMSGLLNCGYSVLMGQPYLAVLHGILPLLLVGLTEYHQGVALAIQAAVTELEKPAVAPTVAPIEGLSEKTGRQPASAHLEAERELQPALGVVPEPITQTPLRLVPPPPRAPRRPSAPSRISPQRRAPVRENALAWLTRAHRRGTDLSTITAQQLATAIDGKIDTCRRNLPAWVAAAKTMNEASA